MASEARPMIKSDHAIFSCVKALHLEARANTQRVSTSVLMAGLGGEDTEGVVAHREEGVFGAERREVGWDIYRGANREEIKK